MTPIQSITHSARGRLLLASLLAAMFILIQVIVTFTQRSRPPLILFWDTVTYTVSLLQRLDPQLFRRDTIFANGTFPESIWLSSYLFMRGLRFSYELTKGDWVLTFNILRLLMSIPFFGFLWLFFRAILKNPLLSVGIAIIAFFPAYFTFTNSFWGMPGTVYVRGETLPEALVPEVLYTALSPLLAWMIFKFWFAPGSRQERIRPLIIAAIGITLGLSMYLIHTLNAIAVIEVVGLIALFQFLRRKLPFWTILVFAISAAPLFIIRLFNGAGLTGRLDAIDAQAIMSFGQTYMIFPWTNRWPLNSTSLSFDPHPPLVLAFFALYWSVTLLTLWSLRTAQRRKRQAKVWFVIIQVLYGFLFTSAGYLPLVLLVYGIFRIVRDEEDDLDRTLLLVLIIAQLVGPMQQTLLYFVWQATNAYSLTGIIFEMARIQKFAFLPFYALLGRALWRFTSHLGETFLRYSMIGVVVLLALFNLNISVSLLHPITLACGALLVFTFALVAFASGSNPAPLSSRSRLVLGTFAIGCLVAGFVNFQALQVSIENVGSYSNRLTLDENPDIDPAILIARNSSGHSYDDAYVAAADWAKANTPKDSLFYLTTRDSNFRSLASRSLLLGYTDLPLTIYSRLRSTDILKLTAEIDQAARYPASFACVLSAKGVDYVLTLIDKPLEPCMNGTQSSTPQAEYKNTWFIIYRLAN